MSSNSSCGNDIGHLRTTSIDCDSSALLKAAMVSLH